jgi:stringent starvation protein B
MAPMAKITFKALLDWFMETNARYWNIHVQAAQFDSQEYISTMSPATGMICLNISANATRGFDMDDEKFWFWSRFQGKEIFLEVPYTAVMCAVDPETGIPNLFPYFEDWGDIEMDLPDELKPTDIEIMPNGNHLIRFGNNTSQEMEPLSDEEVEALRADILARAKPDMAIPDSVVKVLNFDGNPVEVKIPTMAELDELNKLWREQGMSIQADGFTVGPDGKLVVRASTLNDSVIHVDFKGNSVPTFDGDATILNFPGKSEIKIEEPKLLKHDTLETRVRDRHWTVIEGGKTKPEATMPWIDTVYREKRARREAAELTKDKMVIGNEMKSTQPEIRSDGSTGESSFFPNLDVSKCTWPGKRKARPEWLTVHKGGEHVA